MPRLPNPDLEDRIVHAADVLWRRGGEKALTMRAVARAAGTNTPAVYRRFNNRQELIRALMLRIVARIREQFEKRATPEETAEAYIEYALRNPNEYLLFYSHASALNPPKGRGRPRPIRESRPNFAFTEQLLAKDLGGGPEDHTQLAIALWATLHGTAMLLLTKSFPEGHEEDLLAACRSAVKVLIESRRRR